MYALGMTPIVARVMVRQNASLPRAFKNLDGYVTELLIRSYASSWTMLTEAMALRVVLVSEVLYSAPW